MMRNQRSYSPLVALFAFEIGAILLLTALGKSPSMQIPFDDLSTWLANGSLEELAAPIVRLTALCVAYWLLTTTTLSVLAQVSRVPAAIRATSAFTLPSVRRVVDGAMAVSIAGASIAGTGGAAMAADYGSSPSYANDRSTYVVSAEDQAVYSDDGTVYAGTEVEVDFDLVADDGTVSEEPSIDDMSVNTPRPIPVDPNADDETAVPTPTVAPVTEAPATTPAPPAPTPTTEAPAPTTQAPAPTTQAPTPTTQAPTPTTEAPAPTTQAPTPTTAAPVPTPAIPGDGAEGWVPTPRPQALDADAQTPVEAPAVATPTPETAAPETPAPEAAAPAAAPEVLGEQTHRVQANDNLWTISRDAVAQSTNRDASEISEAEIRSYWLKVIDANRGNLRSQDPHWIFPGEVINLPPLEQQ